MDDNNMALIVGIAILLATAVAAVSASGAQAPTPPDTPPPGPVTPPPPAVSPEDRDLLARLIHAEAEDEPYEGQVAVGATVLNRVESPDYPDNIPDVVYQIDSGYYQYEVVKNGRIDLPADPEAFDAADEALAGSDPSLGAIGFYNPEKATNEWVLSRPVTVKIGQHVFFK